jgi:phthiocerol/phenolphthiocerol synthesis type-I polyketide synthase C
MTFSQQAQSMGSPEPIAIIGVGCKLPGNITSTDELLRALREGRDLIKEIPPERWDVDAL